MAKPRFYISSETAFKNDEINSQRKPREVITSRLAKDAKENSSDGRKWYNMETEFQERRKNTTNGKYLSKWTSLFYF